MQGSEFSNPDKRKLLSIVSHAAIFFSVTMLSIGIPIGVLFTSDDPIVKENAKESINFHFNVWFWGGLLAAVVGVLSFLSFGLLGLILSPLIGLGFLIHWSLTAWAIVHCLNDPDQPFRYPFIFRLF